MNTQSGLYCLATVDFQRFNMFDATILSGLSFDELTEAKDTITAMLKKAREDKKVADAEAKVKAADKIAETVRALIAEKKLDKGTKFVAMFKGAEREFVADGVTEATIAVTIAEGKRYIKHAAFVRLAE